MPDLLAAADFVVSRAGATTLFELLALEKPMLLIPLVFGSRGDQVTNAESFAQNGWAHVLSERGLTPQSFLAAITRLEQSQSCLREAVRGASAGDSQNAILELFEKCRV